jgi:superfamily II RNA helicase
MITPINNITFKGIFKSNKIEKNKQNQQKPYAINSIYSKNVNFTGYLGQKRKVTLEEGIENNFFQLPKITLEDGSLYQIQPDKSQIECARKLCNGKNVVFDAPTGMGKTAIAHFAMSKNLAEDKKTVYTVPIKALANDKYVEFSKIYGSKNVGILTGDRKINSNAPIVIMTTEIFDHQAQSMTLNEALKTGTVVYDEAHYIGDEERGMAWEHSIMNAASKGVQILALSATIGNAGDFTKWIGKIPGARPTERVEVKSENRPVPLVWHLFRQTKEDQYLAPILIGEVDLTSNLDDLSYDIADVIYQAEKEYFERRHEANKDKIGYNNEFLIDANYKYTIIPKLEETLGKDWIKADFSDDEIYSKLKEVFKGIAGPDMVQIACIAQKSGTGALTDLQKTALGVLYRSEYGYDESYEMTDDDYDYMYRQLKMAIGEGNNGFRCDTELFRRKLSKEFRSLSKDQVDQITQLMARADVKNSRMIHENWHEDNYIQLIEKLRSEDMLPAIIFKLAQGGCEQVANSMTEGDEEKFNDDELSEAQLKELEKQAGELDLLTSKEKEQVEEIIKKYEK